MLRDLGFQLERGPDIPHRIVIPAPRETRAPHGGVRAGIVATGVDVVAAVLALRSLSPDWLATADLAVWTRSIEQVGPLVGEARVLRSGATTTVIEVGLVDSGNQSQPVAQSTATFVRIKRPQGTDLEEREEEPGGVTVVDFATPDAGLDAPFVDLIGYRILDARGGEIELPRSEYTVNSFDSLQGGMVALLIELAAEAAAREASGRPCGVLDLSVRYLAPGPNGPYRTRAEPLRIDRDGALLRVEVHDIGANRCMAVGTASTRVVGEAPRPDAR